MNFETIGADGKEKRVADQPKKQEKPAAQSGMPEMWIPRPHTAKWFRVGMPCCPVDQGPMVLEKPLPKEEGGDPEEGAPEEEALAELLEEL